MDGLECEVCVIVLKNFVPVIFWPLSSASPSRIATLGVVTE
jgi:hypothetical protein